jgi:hypothetical protein
MDAQVREFFPVSLSKLTAFLQAFEDVTASGSPRIIFIFDVGKKIVLHY